MITYELAEKLKEAGFPQEDRHWYWCSFTFPKTLWCINALEAKKLEKEYECMTACPTISELIEACGNRFFKLTQRKEHWVADALPRKGEPLPKNFKPIFGSTPEEAVAKLWLELNKK